MNSRIKNTCWIILAGSGACLLYFWVARILQLNYTAKSLIKLLLFLGLPVLYWIRTGRFSRREVISLIFPRREQLPRLLGSVAVGVLAIAVANLLAVPLCRMFGIESVIGEIRTRTHTGSQQLQLALIYIPLVNALAEELFFRGFIVSELAGLGYDRLALCFPAALFALYHLAIFQNWFNPGIMALTLGGLFLCGLLLGRIVRRDRNILGVWMLHGLVNVAIISISLQFF